ERSGHGIAPDVTARSVLSLWPASASCATARSVPKKPTTLSCRIEELGPLMVMVLSVLVIENGRGAMISREVLFWFLSYGALRCLIKSLTPLKHGVCTRNLEETAFNWSKSIKLYWYSTSPHILK